MLNALFDGSLATLTLRDFDAEQILAVVQILNCEQPSHAMNVTRLQYVFENRTKTV
jgi:hypothetical protein